MPVPLFSFEGKQPDVHPSAWIAPTATLIGAVTVRANASVWYGTVLRADFGPIVVEEGANVQDNTVIHCGESGAVIGTDATVGHSCVVHDARIGARALVGNQACVLDGASIGEATLVAAGSTVSPGTEVPPDVVALGSPAKRFEPKSEAASSWVEHNPAIYQRLAARHRAGIEQVGP